MGRLFWTVFWSKDDHGHAHESPAVMTTPLIFLAILSGVGGFIGIPHFLYPEAAHPELNMSVALISSAAAILGLVVSYLVYGKRPNRDPLETKLGFIYPVLKNKYYFDALYGWYVDCVQQRVAATFKWIEDIFIVRSGIHGLTGLAKATGDALRKLQTGLVQSYALVFVFGFIFLFFIMVIKL